MAVFVIGITRRHCFGKETLPAVPNHYVLLFKLLLTFVVRKQMSTFQNKI